MSSNNRNKQYIIIQILTQRGYTDPEHPDLADEREELAKFKILDLHLILRELKEDAENEPHSLMDRLTHF